MKTSDDYRETLLARKAELVDRLAKVEDLLDDPKSQSFSHRSSA